MKKSKKNNMKRTKIDLKNLLEPRDIIPILAVLIGIIVAISYDELEIRLIGACIFILGGVPLFISITGKLPEMIARKHKPEQTKEYNYNIIRQNNAIRFVVEDSEFSNSAEYDNKTEDHTFQDQSSTSLDNIKTSPGQKLNNFNFNDGDSGVKIIRTFKPNEKVQSSIEIDKSITPGIIDDKEEFDNSDIELITKSKDENQKSQMDTKTVNIHINKDHKEIDHTQLVTPSSKELVKNYREKTIEVPLNLLMESEPLIIEEPKKEFEHFLHRILDSIRSVINTKTVIFLLVNFDKRELILQAYSSDIKEAIIKKRKIPLGNDIVSQIVINSKPEILTEINSDAEIDLIPYYSVQTNTQSFIGMPVIYKKSVIGILCADSTLADAYDSVTVNFLGQFAKLISSLVHSYTEKFDLLQSAKTLNAINSLRKFALDRDFNIDDFYIAIKDVIKSIFDYQTIGVCSYNNHNGTWYISSYYSSLNENNFEGLEIEPSEVLIGESILSYKTIYISPIIKGQIRVMNGENSYENGFFVSVPLKSCSYNYGALYVEGNNPSACSENDIHILETIGEQAGAIIEQLYYADVVNIKDILESQTGILSSNSFFNRINQELNRVNDYQSNFCLCQIRIDKYAAYLQEMFKEKSELIYNHVINIIKKFLRPYDILGKTDDNTLGIILVGMNLNQSQLWAERLRTEIAKTFLIIKTKRYNATISIGIAEANNMTSLEEIISNSSKALEIASLKSNKVVIYQ